MLSLQRTKTPSAGPYRARRRPFDAEAVLTLQAVLALAEPLAGPALLLAKLALVQCHLCLVLVSNYCSGACR